MRSRIWGIIAAAVASVCMFGTQYVYADETQAVVYSVNNFFDSEEDAVEYFNLCIMEQDEVIELILSDDLCKDTSPGEVFSQLLDKAAMYYETGGLSYSSSKVSGGTKFTVYPNYKITVVQNEALNQAIDDALKSMELDGKSEYQKVRAIHDYICDHVDYDFTYNKYTAYDAMMTGEAVCQGFANLFFRMCYETGLDVELITGIGNGGGHAWNIIKIGDVYYNIDVTWDGQNVDTRHTYFLKSEKEFVDHYREDHFDTEEYHKGHPMANDSWMDFSGISETESVDNLGQIYFNTIDGGTVSNRAENNRPKILIFGSTKGCTNTSDTVSEISGSDFKDVDVVMIDANMATLATVQNFKTKYGNGNNSIIYSYDEGYGNLSVMWDYVDAVGIDMQYFPLVVYIDSDNKIQYSDFSNPLSAVYVRNIVDTYLYHQPISSISSTKVTVDVKDSTRLYVNVYGVRRNAQFVTWSSSDPAVAVVDENGVIKGIEEGTANITCKINDIISHTCTVTVKMPDGLNIGADGKLAYYKNGVVDTSFTGMAKNEDGWWYIKKGKFDNTYTGMVLHDGKWIYVNKGEFDTGYTGMAKNEHGWWYMKAGVLDKSYIGMILHNGKWIYINKGKFDTEYTGMAKNEHGWWYMKAGVLDRTYTGMAKNEHGWWYMKAGVLDKSYTGMILHNGKWIYINKGKFDTEYTGMAKNEHGWWYMKAGVLDRTYTGMAKNEYGWWYMKAGVLDRTYTGMAKNEHGWWYMTNGELDRTYTGMAKNEHGWWYFVGGSINKTYTGMILHNGKWIYINKGKFDTEYTGMAKNEHGWWYMTNGELDRTYTGMAKNAYGWWYMKEGKLDTSYTGLATNEYGTWYMKKGKLDTSYNGEITFNGKKYTIKNGKVV